MEKVDDQFENIVICCICGGNHSFDNCKYIIINNHVPDKNIPSKARLTLPDILRLHLLADGTKTIRTNEKIEKGTQFGPLEAKKTFTLNPCITFPLKVFPNDNEEFLEYYLDTTDENDCTWMIFVESATCLEEQNLLCYQEKEHIYFLATKNINEDETLKVWYSPYFAQKMNKPLLSATINYQTDIQIDDSLDVNALMKQQQNILDRNIWTCKFCGILKTNVTEFASHILEHYLSQLKKICEICKASFNSRKALQKHTNVLHSKKLIGGNIHEKAPDNAIKIPSTKDIPFGGPLLNNLQADSSDNSNLFMTSADFDVGNLGNGDTLLEPENLNVDNLIYENVKQLDHFNFEIDESKEEFVCDICLKCFLKLRYLVEHLRKHTGDYFCHVCHKIFGRNESLKYHSCNGGVEHVCPDCGRTFIQQKNYNRHINSVHEKKYTCDKCCKKFCSKVENEKHNCTALPDAEKTKFFCTICSKEFLRDIYLRKHIRSVHLPKQTTEKVDKSFVCDICAKLCVTRNAYQMHIRTHQKAQFQCDTCNKKFFRKDVYNDHLATHSNQKFHCVSCSKVFKTEKSLYMHNKSIHLQVQTYECVNCDAKFKYKTNLHKHSKIHLRDLKQIHLTQGDVYVCTYCNKTLKLKSSLVRHINRIHPEYRNQKVLSNAVKPKNNAFMDYAKESNDDFDNDAMDLLEGATMKENIDIINDSEMCINDLDTNSQIQIIENILNSTTKEMGIDLNEELLNIGCGNMHSNVTSNDHLIPPLESREVCLSMPDLTDADQDITLGKNAYILENGTIVEPQENPANVVVYVLDGISKI